MTEHIDLPSPDSRPIKPYVWAVALVAAVGGLVFGIDIGGSGGTFIMDPFRSFFGWDHESDEEIARQEGNINAFFTAGAAVGAIPSGPIADKIGRRPCIIFGSAVFSAGAFLQLFTPNLDVLYLGRAIGGAGVGLLSATVPVYISECAPQRARGSLSTLWQLAITFGIVLISVLNIPLSTWHHGWRASYGCNGFLSIFLVVQMFAMPESPRYLATNGQEARLREVLARLRHADEVEAEVADISAKVAEERAAGEGAWRDLAGVGVRRRVGIGVGLQVLQQFSGINAIMFFAPQIFTTYFSARVSLYGTIAINLVNFLATFITVLGVDKLGRVSLLVVGAASMCVCHIIVAGLASGSGTGVGVGILVLTCLFVISFAYSWGPVCWVVCAEIFPLRLRSKATAVTTAANWTAATVLGKSFPLLANRSLPAAFGLFAAVCAGATSFVYLVLPETAGLTLEQMDRAFDQHRPALRRRFWAESQAARRGTTELPQLQLVPSTAVTSEAAV